MHVREMVVARCHEDISWIDRFPFEKTVYDKGDGTKGIPLPNIGREGHTFIHHIITRWDSLSDVTIFLQGNPYEHEAGLNKKAFDEVDWFTWIADWFTSCDENGPPHYGGSDIKRLYETASDRIFPKHVEFGAGGQFAATRDCLRHVPLSKWEWLFEEAERNKFFPWLMERIWGELLKLENHLAKEPVLVSPDL